MVKLLIERGAAIPLVGWAGIWLDIARSCGGLAAAAGRTATASSVSGSQRRAGRIQAVQLLAKGLAEAFGGGRRHRILCFGIEQLLADGVGTFDRVEALDCLLNSPREDFIG